MIDFQHALAHATQARHQLLQWRATLRHRVPELKKQSQYWRVAEKTLPNLDKVKALIQLAESINSLGRSLAASCSNDDPGPCTNDIASALNHLKQRAQDAGLDEVVLLDTLHDPAIVSLRNPNAILVTMFSLLYVFVSSHAYLCCIYLILFYCFCSHLC